MRKKGQKEEKIPKFKRKPDNSRKDLSAAVNLRGETEAHP